MFDFAVNSNFIEKLSLPFFPDQVSLDVLRLDKIHPLISGNKWFKLKYNLLEAKNQSQNTLLTFGGAYSNHIVATAAAGEIFGFQTIGIIRGEEIQELNPYLQKAKDLGMRLHFVSREAYRQKNEENFVENLKNTFGDFYLLPEGGSNALALKGTKEILNFLKTENLHYDFVCTCVGTGGTLAGIAASLYGLPTKILGLSVLKNASFLYQEVYKLLEQAHSRDFSSFQLLLDYHFGGYAKHKPELLDFIKNFSSETQIPLEPVYTGKLFFGIVDLLQKGFFPKKAKILLIHCGGVLNL